MKLVGYRRRATVRVAALDGSGHVLDLADVDDFYTDPNRWMATANSSTEKIPLASLELVPPVPAAARIICVGLNYRAHAAEGGFDLPEYPTVFGRWTPSLAVDGTPVPVPGDEPGLDWEGELAVVLGSPLSDATEQEARDAFLGYAVFNDLTARRAQRRGTQWTLGKNADRSGPIGPIVTSGDVPDIEDGLRLRTRVNGQVVQDTMTSDMIFSPAQVAAYLSKTLTLLPGDVIATGTPSGVGHARDPEWFLSPGDVVSVEIEQLGIVTNPIVERQPAGAAAALHQATPA